MTREIRTGFCEIPFTRLEHITCRLFTGRRLIENLSLIGFHNTKRNDGKNTGKAVHFYMDDYKFECVWNRPERYLRKLSQYRFVLTPDFSLYTNMPLAMQIWNVFRGQWCGAFWQANGLTVVPSVGWGDERSFAFCFDGIEKGATVAVSTLGAKKHKDAYLRGFEAMLERTRPERVICYSEPFPEMKGRVIPTPYLRGNGGGADG